MTFGEATFGNGSRVGYSLVITTIMYTIYLRGEEEIM